MDGFTYNNIFDTKGLEYIVIIIFLMLIIPFWIFLNNRKEITTEIRKAIKLLSAKISNSPQGVYFTRNHTWAFLEKSGAATIGLDELLLHMTGKFEIRFIKDKDDDIRQGDLIAEIDQQGKRLRIYSPVSGKILKINNILAERPGIINKDPYEKGWILSVKPVNWKAETRSFYLSDEARDWLNREMVHIRDFISTNAAKYSPGYTNVTLQDGGELNESLLSEMPEGLWQDFQQEFLDPR